MTHTMMTDHAAIGVYSSHTAAEAAVRKLQQDAIPMDKISIIGGSAQIHEALLGHYEPPQFLAEGMKHQSEKEGMKLFGLFGLLAGFSSFLMPGIGLLVVLGPLAGLLGGIGAGAAMGGIVSVMSFHDIAADYRDWLAAGNFLVIVHCTSAEEPSVKQVLESTEPLSLKSHKLPLRISPQPPATQPSNK